MKILPMIFVPKVRCADSNPSNKNYRVYGLSSGVNKTSVFLRRSAASLGDLSLTFRNKVVFVSSKVEKFRRISTLCETTKFFLNAMNQIPSDSKSHPRRTDTPRELSI